MISEIKPGHLYYELKLPTRGHYSFLLNSNALESRALMTIGSAVFEFERYLKLGQHNRLDIGIDYDWPNNQIKKKIEECLERLVSFVFLSNTKIKLVKKAFYDNGFVNKDQKVLADAVCLFSGGVDSISGLLHQGKGSKLLAVFCSHSHQPRIISLVRKLQHSEFQRQNVDLYEVAVPDIDTTGYAQSRGFLYMLSAASVAAAHSISKIIVSEVGPTMYQPQFGPADQVTMTTHPFVIERVTEIIELLNLEIEIICPYENTTKAEIMLLCPRPKLISVSHSCISQRLPIHDGTCYGCVIRRLASIATGVNDTDYAKNPLQDENSKIGNLLSLLEFCSDVLIDKKNIPTFQRNIIDQYGKWELFNRFALDNFTALYRYKRTQTLCNPIVRIYDRVYKHFGGTEKFRQRLIALKSIRANR